jgi:hypothetical protein
VVCRPALSFSLTVAALHRYRGSMLRATGCRVIIVGLAVLAVSGAAFAQDDVQSTANFYSEGECRFEFTIAWRNRAEVKGSLLWADGDLRLRLPGEAFVVADGKLAKNEEDVFGAILLHKKLGVGLWRDGTIFPIDLTGLDRKPFVACVKQRWRSVKRAVAR